MTCGIIKRVLSYTAISRIPLNIISIVSDPSSSVEGLTPSAALANLIERLGSQRSKKAGKAPVSPPAAGKPPDPRRPKPFTGEGDQDQAGVVRRDINNLDLYLKLSNVAVDAKFEHALLFLDGTAADYMHTVAQNLPVVDQTWLKFCELLRVRFGTIDPDAEFWDSLRDLKQGTLTAAEYAHKMRHCFNGITGALSCP